MPILLQESATRSLPSLRPVIQTFPRPRLDDVWATAHAAVRARLSDLGAESGKQTATPATVETADLDPAQAGIRGRHAEAAVG